MKPPLYLLDEHIFSHCNTPALASSHMDELADIAVLFGFEVDIDELPELMKDMGAGQCCQ